MDPRDPRIPVETEYDWGGNTKRLPPGSRTEVSFEEGQHALGKWQLAGVALEYVKD
jgi:hypothetical protein